jgi:hypothetical protein
MNLFMNFIYFFLLMSRRYFSALVAVFFFFSFFQLIHFICTYSYLFSYGLSSCCKIEQKKMKPLAYKRSRLRPTSSKGRKRSECHDVYFVFMSFAPNTCQMKNLWLKGDMDPRKSNSNIENYDILAFF